MLLSGVKLVLNITHSFRVKTLVFVLCAVYPTNERRYGIFIVSYLYTLSVTWAVTQVEAASAPESKNTVFLSLGLELSRKNGHPVLHVRDPSEESSDSDEKKGVVRNASSEDEDSAASAEVSKETEKHNNDENNKPESKSASAEYNDESGPIRSTRALDTTDFEPKEPVKADSLSVDDNQSE